MRYETWAFERMREKTRCAVEPSMTCIPLMNDPICRACYEEQIAAPLDVNISRNDGHCEEGTPDEAISGGHL